MRRGSGLLKCHRHFVQGANALSDSNNRWLRVLLFPQLVLFLLLAGAPLWQSADHEFASGQKWTEDKEGYRLELERDFFFHLPLFPLSVSHYLDSAGDMYWALVGSRRRRTSREQRH